MPSLPHGALNNVRWHVHPAALLLGGLSATVRADSDLGHVSGEIHRSVLGTNALDDVQGEATVGWLSDLAGYTFVPISGRIGLNLDHLTFDDNLDISASLAPSSSPTAGGNCSNPPLALGRFEARLDRGKNGVRPASSTARVRWR